MMNKDAYKDGDGERERERYIYIYNTYIYIKLNAYTRILIYIYTYTDKYVYIAFSRLVERMASVSDRHGHQSTEALISSQMAFFWGMGRVGASGSIPSEKERAPP
jgi:predicted membrane-bound mannosyltransferase